MSRCGAAVRRFHFPLGINVPIYEFYCGDCHRIYNFLSRTVNTAKRPACPRCGRPKLERKVSRFAISKNRVEPQGEDDLPPGLDESKMESLLDEIARQSDGIDEDDPRAMARMMRKLYDGTGMHLGPGMEEAMRRMEAGEDPDQIEEDMGDVLEQEDPMMGTPGSLRQFSRRLRAPSVDETLYEL